MEKHDECRVYSVVYYDIDQKYHYIKRFAAHINGKPQNYLPENTKCEFVHISTEDYPRHKLLFGGKHKNRKAEEVDVESFIAIKGFKAKGKRLSYYEIIKIEELEPLKSKEEQKASKEEQKASKKEQKASKKEQKASKKETMVDKDEPGKIEEKSPDNNEDGHQVNEIKSTGSEKEKLPGEMKVTNGTQMSLDL
ncbi:hypothetical protein ES705_32820 [subsurface metagenome]